MKVRVAIPAYDCKVSIETVRALLQEQALALVAGAELEVAFVGGCSLITLARNQMVQDFLDGEADRLVFIDADVAWEAGSLLKVAQHPVDFVGGAYRIKEAWEAYPVHWLDRPELVAKGGLLEVASVPGGFLSLSRAVFERIEAHFPGRRYSHLGRAFNGFFHAPIMDGHLYGEDTAFCHDWREAGGQVWLDPTLNLTHVGGSNSYEGCIGEWLLSREAA